MGAGIALEVYKKIYDFQSTDLQPIPELTTELERLKVLEEQLQRERFPRRLDFFRGKASERKKRIAFLEALDEVGVDRVMTVFYSHDEEKHDSITQKDGSFDEGEGAEFAKGKIEGVLGIPIHYFAVIDFEGFKEVIETVGGVEVCVERAFDDYSYPVPGHESDPIISRRYEHLHFNSGCQLMDEETALKYARSRTGTNGEGNDFARVRRQQNVIMGVKDKIFSLNLLTDSGKIVKLYQQFSKSLRTNMTLGELKRALEIAQKVVDFAQVKSLVLDPDSQLVYHPDPASYGGAYVLVPTGGNYEKIHSAIRGLLFVGKTDAEAQSE